MLVQEDIYDQFMEKVVARTEAIKLGDEPGVAVQERGRNTWTEYVTVRKRGQINGFAALVLFLTAAEVCICTTQVTRWTRTR